MNEVEIRTGETGPENPNVAPANAGANPSTETPKEGQNSPKEAPKVDGLPEKFKSVEDLVKAYQELEKKQGAPKAEEAPKVEAPKPEAVANVSEADFAKYTEEFNTTGNISEASIKELTSKGIPQSYINQYVEMAKAVTANNTASVMAEAGGPEGYKEVVAWAKESMSPDEIKAYNSIMDGGDINQQRLAVAALNAKYTGAVGKPQKLISGKPSSGAGSDVYGSVEELQKDMSSNDYRSGDPAFQKKVHEKLSRSNIMGGPVRNR